MVGFNLKTISLEITTAAAVTAAAIRIECNRMLAINETFMVVGKHSKCIEIGRGTAAIAAKATTERDKAHVRQ